MQLEWPYTGEVSTFTDWLNNSNAYHAGPHIGASTAYDMDHNVNYAKYSKIHLKAKWITER